MANGGNSFFNSFLASGGTFDKWYKIGLRCCKRAIAPCSSSSMPSVP